MPAKSVFCTEGLTPRVIAPNEYQLVSADERDAAIRRHFDQLSTFLQKADRQRATNRQDNIVVQSLFNTKRGKHGADNGVVTEPKSRDRDDRRGGADGGKRPTGSDAAARPKTASTREKDRPGPSAEETVGARQPANTPNLVDRKELVLCSYYVVVENKRTTWARKCTQGSLGSVTPIRSIKTNAEYNLSFELLFYWAKEETIVYAQPLRYTFYRTAHIQKRFLPMCVG